MKLLKILYIHVQTQTEYNKKKGMNMAEPISAAKSTSASGRKAETPYTPNSYDRKGWLENQWRQGATVWTVPHAGAAYNS